MVPTQLNLRYYKPRSYYIENANGVDIGLITEIGINRNALKDKTWNQVFHVQDMDGETQLTVN